MSKDKYAIGAHCAKFKVSVGAVVTGYKRNSFQGFATTV
jgi:hypothetical protein